MLLSEGQHALALRLGQLQEEEQDVEAFPLSTQDDLYPTPSPSGHYLNTDECQQLSSVTQACINTKGTYRGKSSKANKEKCQVIKRLLTYPHKIIE